MADFEATIETIPVVPTTMHGVVTEAVDGGFIADMSRPEKVAGVFLPVGGLCVTRGYANPDARTRITNLHAPELPVAAGSVVVASVTSEKEYTGQSVSNPAWS